MNSTRWVTLTEFVKHLGRSGICKVDETEKGWFIAWIDSSPKALAKQEAAMKKERSTTSDEQRERMLIAEQIDRAKAEHDGSGSPEASSSVEEGLKREEGSEKVVLSFSAKPSFSTAPLASSLSLKPNPLKLKANPLRASVNPLKRPNVLKSTTPSSGATAVGSKRATPVEQPIAEEQERKRRRTDQEAAS